MQRVTFKKRAVSVFLLFVLFVSFNPRRARATPDVPIASEAQKPTTISPAVLARLGISHPAGANMLTLSQQVARQVQANHRLPGGHNPNAPTSGNLPSDLNIQSALSPAVITTLSGNGQFNEVDLMGDLDGRQDLTADHSTKVDDLGSMPAGWTLTRAAISEHAIANGFQENVFYYGDSFGNVYVTAQPVTTTLPITTTVLNLPTLLNAFGKINSDDQVVITGLAVNPVADLSSYARVNSDFSFFDGQIGEILLVTYLDTGGGLRLTTNDQLVRSGVLAFPIADTISPPLVTNGIASHPGFPVTVGTSFGVAFSAYSNLAGVTVDDDGNAYFQQVDLIGFSGANIVKIASLDQPNGSLANQDRSLATSGILTITTLNPQNDNYGNTSGPSNQVNHFTNYSGTSPVFGNITALAAGPNNVLYAALARSYNPADDLNLRNTDGLFTNPDSVGPTPSMIISFADTSGATDICSAPPGSYTVVETGPTTVTVPFTGSLPIGDGIADVAYQGLQPQAGVNNYRIFALGDGPDTRTISSTIGAAPDNTLKLDFQVDYTIYSGLSVDEADHVYVVSGGTPANVGRDPSPNLGEVLVFPDARPYDRRADAIDLRGDTPPDGPIAGSSPGDGQSDRFDHIFWMAPLDPLTLTPAGIAGLNRGFLLYLNRKRNNPMAFPGLPNGSTQGDNAYSGPLLFDSFDGGHQVAGGDDQNPPFTGDDSDGTGNITDTVPLFGGFEFVCTGGGADCVQPLNAFYLNSNGSLTIASGDTSPSPAPNPFLSGSAKIAPAWADLNTASRTMAYTNTFPVQALGFAGINDFKVRWINVPEHNKEACGSQNTFAVSLFDDGTGVDENANQPLNPANRIGNNLVAFDLQEGPTAPRYYLDPRSGLPVGVPPRGDGSGYFRFDYGRMDLLGTPDSPVIVGYSAGGLSPSVLPANLSKTAIAQETAVPNDPAWPIGTPAAHYELFDTAVPPTITVSAGITMPVYARPVFDLRFAGNDPALSTPINQPDADRGRVDMVNKLPPVFSAQQLPAASTAAVGLPISYTLTILNPGIPASDVTISQTLPLSATFNAADQGGVATASGIRWTGLSIPTFGFLNVSWSVIPDCDTVGKLILDPRSLITATQNLVPIFSNTTEVQGVLQAAQAEFSLSDSGGGGTFDFTNMSQYANQFNWDFGDGSTSTEVNPTHTFLPGSYAVQLTASSLCSSATVSQTVTIPNSSILIYLPELQK